MTTRKTARDAKTGQYTTLADAKRRPSTTVVETNKTPPPKPGPKKGK